MKPSVASALIVLCACSLDAARLKKHASGTSQDDAIQMQTTLNTLVEQVAVLTSEVRGLKEQAAGKQVLRKVEAVVSEWTSSQAVMQAVLGPSAEGNSSLDYLKSLQLNRSDVHPVDPHAHLYRDTSKDCPKLGTIKSNEGKYRFRLITFGRWQCDPCLGARGHRGGWNGKACRSQMEFWAKPKGPISYRHRFFVVDSLLGYGLELEYLGIVKRNDGLKTARWAFRSVVYGQAHISAVQDWLDNLDFAIQEIPGATRVIGSSVNGVRFYATFNKISSHTNFIGLKGNSDNLR